VKQPAALRTQGSELVPSLLWPQSERTGSVRDLKQESNDEGGTKRLYANCGAWVDDSYPTFIALTDSKIQLRDGNDLSVLEEIDLNIL
jgi:hypothetical protein